jgi:antitoxin PrlF
MRPPPSGLDKDPNTCDTIGITVIPKGGLAVQPLPEYSSVTVKGQVTIPKSLRDKFDIGRGDKVRFSVQEVDGEPRIVLSKASEFTALLDRVSEEVRRSGITRSEAEEWLEKVREQVFRELYPNV